MYSWIKIINDTKCRILMYFLLNEFHLPLFSDSEEAKTTFAITSIFYTIWLFFKPYKVPFNIGKVVFWYTYRYQQYWACLHLSQENYITWFKFMYKWANIRICLSLFSLVDTQFESQFKTKCLYCWKVIVFRIT